jgi:hypothetical protein
LFVNSIVLRSAANLALKGRFTGNQFDDDQNLLPLGRASLLDAKCRENWEKALRYSSQCRI